MTVISITISESDLQMIAGIPANISIIANIPSTIFYTLDGTTPTISSNIVIGPIVMPTNVGGATLSVFATDGVNNSPIITKSYGSTIVGDRNPRSTVLGLNDLNRGVRYPFGSQDPGRGTYGETGGITVDDPSQAQIPDGYDGTATGTPSNYTNQPLSSYNNIFSETNAIGQMGAGIGNLPAGVKIIIPPPLTPGSVASGSADTSSAYFNSRALVIYDDFSKEPYDPDVPKFNRPQFSLEDNTRARYGANLLTSDQDSPPMRGSALKSHYNPRDNTMNYYYYDGDTNRWIISKVPFVPNDNVSNFATVITGRNRNVLPWRLWGQRYLF